MGLAERFADGFGDGWLAGFANALHQATPEGFKPGGDLRGTAAMFGCRAGGDEAGADVPDFTHDPGEGGVPAETMFKRNGFLLREHPEGVGNGFVVDFVRHTFSIRRFSKNQMQVFKKTSAKIFDASAKNAV
jgi:hypothetical protein